MDKNKKFISLVAFLLFCVLSATTLYRWVHLDTIDGWSVFLCFLSLSYFFNAITWGDFNGGGKDELDRHIQSQSAKIGYFVLMILSSLILVVTERSYDLKDIENYPLLIVVGLTFITLPITEFIYSRKYRTK